MDTPKTIENYRGEVAHIGKSVLIKGELSGSEDLYLDGEVEGSIELGGHSLTVGPNGRIRAHINSRDVVVHGRVEGNIRGSGHVELKKTAVVMGDVATPRIIVEDGACLKGSIDVQRDVTKLETPRREIGMASAPEHSSVAGSSSSSSSSKG